MAILQAKGLSKRFGSKQALHQVSIDLNPGRIRGLLGPNGAGKTTLLRCLHRILRPDEGQILYQGQPLQDQMLRHLGYLPEERGMYPGQKVGEQLLYLARLRGLEKKEAQKKMRYWLEKYNLQTQEQQKLLSLSKGMAQKIQLIAALLHEPTVLILDEPFTGFDPVVMEQVQADLKQLRDAGTALLLATHRMEAVAELCDDITFLHQGKLLQSGRYQELTTRQESPRYELHLHQEGSADPPARRVEDYRRGILRILIVEDGEAPALLAWAQAQGELVYFRQVGLSMKDLFYQSLSHHD